MVENLLNQYGYDIRMIMVIMIWQWGWYNSDHWQEQYSGVVLEDVTDYMELPLMPTKRIWKVFSTNETQELVDGEFIKREGLESFLNKIEKVGWNIHSFVNRQDTMHQFVVAYRYVPYDEEKDKKIGPAERIRMAAAGGGQEEGRRRRLLTDK